MKRLPTLEEVTAQLEAQDCELAACVDALRTLDPALELAVSLEWMNDVARERDVEALPSPMPWAIRG